MDRNDILRRIPKVDEVLKQHLISDCFDTAGRGAVTKAAQEVISELRTDILAMPDEDVEAYDDSALAMGVVVQTVIDRLGDKDKNILHGVINATGTILHTNLGRAPLCDEATANIEAVSRSYSNLEYDVAAGKRGSRHDIVTDLITELTGAEDAMVVNNNASATLIVLTSMAAGKEVIVSRGELVEIGGSFRIPDIMAQSGAYLKEVGTTNKTKPSDYENAIITAEQEEELDWPDDPRGTMRFETAALMKVHTSNYRVMGFTEEAGLDDLVDIGRNHDIPVIFDMGNGLMVDLSEYGLDEPNVPASLASGVDVMLFSGDKLLGGPQAGIIIGKKKYIEKMKKHPLARALRVDKMTLAALEETLKKYRDTDVAKRDIPVLRMITESSDVLHGRAERLAGLMRDGSLDVKVVQVDDQIGGGSAPMVYLPGWAVSVSGNEKSAQGLERRLRKADVPVIARIHDDELLLCVRTIAEDELDAVAGAFEQ